jgi:hypothetical protein
MRESRTYGSMRGALSNGRPYRARLRTVTTAETQHLDCPRPGANGISAVGDIPLSVEILEAVVAH